MQNITLTYEENIILNQRGFVIKSSFEWNKYLFILLKLHTYIGLFLIMLLV
jgi:hypothetical protein